MRSKIFNYEKIKNSLLEELDSKDPNRIKSATDEFVLFIKDKEKNNISTYLLIDDVLKKIKVMPVYFLRIMEERIWSFNEIESGLDHLYSEEFLIEFQNKIDWDNFDYIKYIYLFSNCTMEKICNRIPSNKLKVIINYLSLEGALEKYTYPNARFSIINVWAYFLTCPTEEDIQKLISLSKEVNINFEYMLQNGKLTFDGIKYFINVLKLEYFNRSAYTPYEYNKIKELFNKYKELI